MTRPNVFKRQRINKVPEPLTKCFTHGSIEASFRNRPRSQIRIQPITGTYHSLHGCCMTVSGGNDWSP